MEEPPQVPRATFTLGTGGPVTLTLSGAAGVHRVRMAALDPDPVPLLDIPWADGVQRANDTMFTWTPTTAQRAQLNRYCTPAGAHQFATSVWAEDILGHVCTPEQVDWS